MKIKMLNILYLGDSKPHSTSFHRASALQRLGHSVSIFDPYAAISSSLEGRITGAIHYRSGYRFLQPKVRKWLKHIIQAIPATDLIWVNSGELFGPACLKVIKSLGKPVILYNNDDPTGGRDGRRFDSLLRSVKYYDLCLVLRNINIQEYKGLGAKNVMRVNMSYDEVVHKPFEDIDQIAEQFRSSVAFIGTWMRYENRDKFLLQLIEQGVPVSIWGGRWQKSPLWAKLKPYYKGSALGGRDYVAGLQGARICIGMLSKGNRDLHTRRSVEVPYIGGLFCAERTSEHMEMYKEGVEAVFWNSADECARICKELLADEQKRELIRQAGMRRVRELKVGNEDIARQALEKIFKPD
jgi:hypothetical protein